MDKKYLEKLKNLKNPTEFFFNKIKDQHKKRNDNSSNIAGQDFEDYNAYALPNLIRNDIIMIWDSNDHKSIPPKAIKEIFGDNWDLVSKVLHGHSYGLDKIVQFNDGAYGFVSDKSVLHDKLTKDKIEGLIVLYPKLKETVKEWIICSNAKDVPKRIKGITKGVITYVLYDDYVPTTEIGRQKEKNLWQLIYDCETKKSKAKEKIQSIFKFTYRNSLQKRYVEEGVAFAKAQFEAGIDSVYHWGEGSMGVGKSLLDQVIDSLVENSFFDPLRTNTPVPVNVNVFDRRKNAKQNGDRALDIRNQYCGMRKEIWVTGADLDKDEDEQLIPHKQTLDVNEIVLEILDALGKNIPIEIMTLNHHAKTILEVEKDLKKHIKGFKFWNGNFDEFDTLATLDRASTWNNWFDIKFCHRWGSTGTPVYNKDKNATHNPFMDNINRFGPRSTFVSVKDAQDQKLIPPLCIHNIGVKLSELKNIPGMPTKGNKDIPILKTPVNGFNTVIINKKERYMNVEELARTFGVIKAFCHRPDLFLNKHITGFTNRLAQALLFKKNYNPIIDAIEGNSLVGKKLKKLVMVLLNEQKSADLNEKKLERLFSEKEAMVLSQKLLGRGVDLQFQTAFHIVIKSTRDMLQEIFRLMRLNDDIAWSDPKQQRHYILITIINDIDPSSPTIDQDFLDSLNGIMDHYESAKTEMENIWKNGQSGGGGGTRQPKSFEAIDIDPNDMNTIVTMMSSRSTTGGFLAGPAVKLHNALLKKMLALPVPTDSSAINRVLQSYKTSKEFEEIYQLAECSKDSFMIRFWRGHLKLCRSNSDIRSNVQKWKLHIKRFIEKREQSVGTLLFTIRDYYEANNIKVLKAPDALQKLIKSKAKKLGITLLKGNGKYKANYVGDLIRGTNTHLSNQDRQEQAKWWEEFCDDSFANRQKALDEVTAGWYFGYPVQQIAKKYGIGKVEMTTILYHPKVYPCRDSNPNGSKFQKLERSKWNEKVEQVLADTESIAKQVFDVYKEWCEAHPHYYPDSTVPGRNNEIRQFINTDIDLNNALIRKWVGPYEDTGKHDDPDSFDGVYTSWVHFVKNKKEINKWQKDFTEKVKKLRAEIEADYKHNGPKGCKTRYDHLNLKGDFIRDLSKRA
jgi:hypothetical protein